MDIRWLAALAGCCALIGCTTSGPVASSSPSPSAGMSSPSPSPRQLVLASPSPSPVGVPITKRVLAPATVLPVVDLCSVRLERYQDGNAGPLFCRSGTLVVDAWTYFAPLDPHVMSLGPEPAVASVQSAICADIGITHATWPMEASGYMLAAAYHGWNFPFDFWMFAQYSGCH